MCLHWRKLLGRQRNHRLQKRERSSHMAWILAEVWAERREQVLKNKRGLGIAVKFGRHRSDRNGFKEEF